MRLLDDEGNLFGRVNVFDAFVLLLVIAILIGGVSWVKFADDGTEERRVTVRVVDERFVIDAIEPGPVPTEDIVLVESVQLRPEIEINATDEIRDPTIADVQVVVRTTTYDGNTHFRGSRLYVGLVVRFDLGTTVVGGKVVDVRELPDG